MQARASSAQLEKFRRRLFHYFVCDRARGNFYLCAVEFSFHCEIYRKRARASAKTTVNSLIWRSRRRRRRRRLCGYDGSPPEASGARYAFVSHKSWHKEFNNQCIVYFATNACRKYSIYSLLLFCAVSTVLASLTYFSFFIVPQLPTSWARSRRVTLCTFSSERPPSNTSIVAK